MKKQLLILLSLGCTSIPVFAQQSSLISQSYVNPYLFNPAMAGTKDNAQLNLHYRKQWQGINDAPETGILTLDGPVKSKRMGLGITLLNERANIIGRMGAYLSYSYHLPVTEKQHVYMGLSLGAIRHQIRFDKIITENPSYQMSSKF